MRSLLTDTDRRRLVAARHELELTQADVAERIGCTPLTVHLVETGKKRPSVDLLDRWCAALHMTLRIEVEAK